MRIRVLLFLLFFLLITTVYAVAEMRSAVQEPKGTTMALTSFTPKLLAFPFELKYPEKWYVREESAGVPSLFITREPVRNVTDKYLVGMGLYYVLGYFVSREPPDSKLSGMAESVIKIVDWDKSKKRFIQEVRSQGNALIAQSELVVSGKPALRLEYESQAVRVVSLRIKAGADLVMITLEAPPAEYAKYKDVFERMITSFHFTR